MPIYNGENYIKRTIPYILDNNSYDFELVLVNDGSKDNSSIICQEYASEDNRVKIINKSNGGIADARNCGLQNSIGDFVCFVDQDDFVEVKIILDIISNNNNDIIIFSTVKDYGNKFVPCDTVSTYKLFNTKKEIFYNCIWPMVYPTDNNGLVSYFGHVWQGIYRKRLIDKAKLDFKTFVSIEDDFLFLLEAFLTANDVLIIPYVGYRWVINLSSTTYNRNYIENMLQKCEQYYLYIENKLNTSAFFDDNLRYKYTTMYKQVLGVRIVINEGNGGDIYSSVKMIRDFRRNNNEYFYGNYLGEGASRRSAKLIYSMLKNNLILIAIIFQKIICVFKSFRR